jgi:hypothetical protein
MLQLAGKQDSAGADSPVHRHEKAAADHVDDSNWNADLCDGMKADTSNNWIRN